MKAKHEKPKSCIGDSSRLLMPQEMAEHLRIDKRALLQNVRLGRIPVVRINDRVLRFHPPTVYAALSQ